MRVQITTTAFAELQDIYEYIAGDNPTAARGVVMRIEQVIDRIGDFPYMARPIDGSGVRIFPVRPFPVKGKNWCLKSWRQRSVEAYCSDILKTSVKYEKKSVHGAVFGRSLRKVHVVG